MRDLSHRSADVQSVARWFDFQHLPYGLPRAMSSACHDYAQELIDALPDGPELVLALTLLLQAKDSAVRAALTSSGPMPARRNRREDHGSHTEDDAARFARAHADERYAE